MIKAKKIIFTASLLLFSSTLLVFAGGKKGSQPALVARQVSASDYVKSSKDMIVSFIDVGQGNCVLIESPYGKTLLYDGGGTPTWSRSSWDPGMEIVVPYLEERGIESLDYTILSHAHDDHVGGLLAVTHNVAIKNFYEPGFTISSVLYKDVLNSIKTNKINYQILKAGEGDKIDLGQDIKCMVFNPPADNFFQGTNSDCNNSSIVLKIKYKNVSILLEGDMERRGELYAVKQYGNLLEANVLQVGHHGSFTSSSKPFLAKVMPEIAVIPVGRNNTFGHPRPETLSNLESIGADIYRTDFDGTVVIYTDGDRVLVETEK